MIKGIAGNICDDCVTMCYSIIEADKREKENMLDGMSVLPSPREMKEYLDKYVI